MKKAGPRKVESIMESRRRKAFGKKSFSTGCRGELKAETLGKLGRTTVGQKDLQLKKKPVGQLTAGRKERKTQKIQAGLPTAWRKVQGLRKNPVGKSTAGQKDLQDQ